MAKVTGRQRVKEIKERLHACEKFRGEMFNKYLSHIEQGLSLDCFGLISKKLIDELIEKYPEEWCKDDIERSFEEGKRSWEVLGRKQADGTCLGNSRTWFYNMSHRYKWSDRVDITSQNNHAVSVNVVNYSTKKSPQGTVEQQGT